MKKMTDREFLEQLVGYEVWANEQWLGTLGRFKDRARAEGVMRHIVGCYNGWLGLVAEWEGKPHDELDLEADMKDLLRRWRVVVQTRDLDEVVEFTGGKGNKRRLSVRELVHHVLNHGSYHRGHLRGLAESEGLADFPETDSLYYFIPRRSETLD
ncbi:hypothetical protein C0431_06130 [bacterium]|nr:hypothetical protein [bacterium]